MEKIYQTLIVDDNPKDVETLVQHLAASNMFYTPYTADSVLSAYQLLTCSPMIDLIFMDMEISGSSGFDLLSLMTTFPPVVVISRHTQYAIDCYDLNVIDFIRKPYTFSRLYRAISRALKITQPAKAPTSLPASTPARETIYLKIGRKTERFFLDEIQLIEAYGIYIKLHTRHNVCVANEKISKIERQLPTNQFIRIHKSCIINIADITRIESKAIYLDKTRLTIGVTFQDYVHSVLKQLAIEQ
jgi:DNA-binding LytR/AlgR family response regulator